MIDDHCHHDGDSEDDDDRDDDDDVSNDLTSSVLGNVRRRNPAEVKKIKSWKILSLFCF